MKVAAIQMNSGPSVDENLEVVSDLVADAAAAGAKLVVLPENGCLMADTHQRRLAVAARGDEVAARLADICLLYTSPSPRDGLLSRMPSSA